LADKNRIIFMGEWDSLAGILGLAFGLGLVHALDGV